MRYIFSRAFIASMRTYGRMISQMALHDVFCVTSDKGYRSQEENARVEKMFSQELHDFCQEKGYKMFPVHGGYSEQYIADGKVIIPDPFPYEHTYMVVNATDDSSFKKNVVDFMNEREFDPRFYNDAENGFVGLDQESIAYFPKKPEKSVSDKMKNRVGYWIYLKDVGDIKKGTQINLGNFHGKSKAYGGKTDEGKDSFYYTELPRSKKNPKKFHSFAFGEDKDVVPEDYTISDKD